MAMTLPSRAAGRGVLSEIDVTPLVDVTLLLLIIFVVRTPMLQRGTDVQFPGAEQSGPKEEERITINLTREGRLDVNNQEVPRASLRYRLIAMTRNRERVVCFRGDAQVPYGLVIEVMDALKAAGIETVGMITEHRSAPLRLEGRAGSTPGSPTTRSR